VDANLESPIPEDQLWGHGGKPLMVGVATVVGAIVLNPLLANGKSVAQSEIKLRILAQMREEWKAKGNTVHTFSQPSPQPYR